MGRGGGEREMANLPEIEGDILPTTDSREIYEQYSVDSKEIGPVSLVPSILQWILSIEDSVVVLGIHQSSPPWSSGLPFRMCPFCVMSPPYQSIVRGKLCPWMKCFLKSPWSPWLLQGGPSCFANYRHPPKDCHLSPTRSSRPFEPKVFMCSFFHLRIGCGLRKHQEVSLACFRSIPMFSGVTIATLSAISLSWYLSYLFWRLPNSTLDKVVVSLMVTPPPLPRVQINYHLCCEAISSKIHLLSIFDLICLTSIDCQSSICCLSLFISFKATRVWPIAFAIVDHLLCPSKVIYCFLSV